MITLRDYQLTAVQSIFDYYARGGEGNPLAALPTGTGKSLIIAEFVRRVLGAWSDQRVLGLTHVKELIVQDLKALQTIWPDAPAAVYSASLGQRQIAPITFGGIATVARNIEAFRGTNIIFIDEAHLVSPKSNTMYRKVIKQLTQYNPNLKVIGTTATIYRLGQGMLTEGKDRLFTDVCCDYTGLDAFNWFIEQGYLASLIPKPMQTQFDLNEVHTLAGDYNKKELARAVDIDEITEQAVDETIEYGQHRRSWLLFATSIEHAIHIGHYLKKQGIRTGVVHSKMHPDDRDRVLRKFRNYEYQAVVNQNILTTGFDHPGLDLIAVLRPTKSTSLWVQMLGRGTRPFPDKENCLVLDFARNTERLGPINDPVLPKAKGKGKGGMAPFKTCPECNTYNHASAKICCCCGFEFPQGVKIYTGAGTEALIKGRANDNPVFEEFDVTNVTYKVHPKNGFNSLKVSYFCGLNKFDEYIHFDRDGGLGKRAIKWLRARCKHDPDRADHKITTLEVMDHCVEHFTAPTWIRVQTNSKFPEIVHYGFEAKSSIARAQASA